MLSAHNGPRPPNHILSSCLSYAFNKQLISLNQNKAYIKYQNLLFYLEFTDGNLNHG